MTITSPYDWATEESGDDYEFLTLDDGDLEAVQRVLDRLVVAVGGFAFGAVAMAAVLVGTIAGWW